MWNKNFLQLILYIYYIYSYGYIFGSSTLTKPYDVFENNWFCNQYETLLNGIIFPYGP